MTIKTAIVLILLFSAGCKNFTVFSRFFYQNNFKISEQKINTYLLKNKIDTAYSYFAVDSFYDIITRPQFQSDSTIGSNEFRPIQFRVFDSTGNLVNIWANCYSPMSYFFKDVNDLVTNKTLPSIILNSTISDYTVLMKKQPAIDFKNYDIIIIAFWQWYMASYSTDMLQQIQTLLNSKNKKVLIIKLNIS